MTVLTPKRPDETVLYTLNLLKELGDDTIKTFTLVSTAGTAVIGTTVNVGAGVTVLISGGASGESNALTLTINTFAEQVIERNYSLLVADGVTAIIPSTSSKRFIIEQAFSAIGLSPYEFDPTPEEYLNALNNLDMQMAEWAVNALDLGYAFPPTLGGGDLDDVSGVPDFAVNAVALSLGQRMAPFIGKVLAPAMLVTLARAMSVVRTKMATIPEYALPFLTIRGAGQKPWSSWVPFQYGGPGGAVVQ